MFPQRVREDERSKKEGADGDPGGCRKSDVAWPEIAGRSDWIIELPDEGVSGFEATVVDAKGRGDPFDMPLLPATLTSRLS